MKVDFLILADRTEESAEGGKLDIFGAGITHARVDAFPGSTRLAAIARLLIEDADADRADPFLLLMRWSAPDGTPLSEGPVLSIPSSEHPRAEYHEDEERSIFWVLHMPSVTFNRDGVYRLELVLDDETVAERTLVVFAEPDEGNEGATGPTETGRENHPS